MQEALHTWIVASGICVHTEMGVTVRNTETERERQRRESNLRAICNTSLLYSFHYTCIHPIFLILDIETHGEISTFTID